MFESLTEKLSHTLRNLRGVGKLSEDNISEALGEVRKALLSADVHFRTAREFVEEVKQACLGQEVLKSVSPGQQVVKIINDELVKLLGEGSTQLKEDKPLRVMMVGLHGAGKTTTSAKLAKRLAKDGRKPMLVACDIYRPAAIDQLEILSKNENFPCYLDRTSKNVPNIARNGWEESKKNGSDLVIFDTAGRLQIDDELVQELEDLKKQINPHEILLVADAALGQEAVNVAKTFHERLDLTGIILTKMDGDARGGAALSMKKVTGAPIKFMGVGEKIDEFEVFHPDRLASRILGMGDVVSLVEKAQEHLDEEESILKAQLLQSTPEVLSQLASDTETAKAILRGESFYEIDKLEWATNTLHTAMARISLGYYPAQICFPPIETDLAYNPFMSSEILEALDDDQINVYRDVYRKLIAPIMKKEKP